MKRLIINIITIIIWLTTGAAIGQTIKLESAETQNENSNNKQIDSKFTSYKLSNGLTIYLNHDPNMNYVLGGIVVKGGAKNDPEDATGIAHYLEHMLFKGTQKIGTTDYKSEKIWLDSIAFMYSMLPYTTGDEEYRKRVYKKIDYYSQMASKYALPGEFDKLIGLIGGQGMNAYTDFEKIVYFNQFPAEYISEWAELYRERFENAVFRLFQTELETVFEEKNMSQDNLMVSVYEEVYKNFYPNSVYGNRTVLGSIEHLQNPSIHKMATYYKQYYVANNMALVLIGNFDLGLAMDIIEKSFGDFRNGDKTKENIQTEPPIKGREQKTIKITPIPMGILGYRIPGAFHENQMAIDLAIGMLNNRQKTGYLDSLNRNNKLMYSMAYAQSHSDLGGLFIGYAPKIPFQNLKAGENLILTILEKIKTGNFSDQYFESVKRILVQDYYLKLENSQERLRLIAESFISNVEWKRIESYPETMMAMDKASFVKIINTYITDQYLAIYSKIGKTEKTRLKKPMLTPFKASEKRDSEYYSNFRNNLEPKINPKFMTNGVDYKLFKINKGTNYYHVANPYNSIFNYNLSYYVGSYELPTLTMVVSYLENVGSKETPFIAFQNELRKIGTTIEFGVNESFLTIKMTGYDQYFVESLKLLNQVLSNPEENPKAIKPYKNERKLENKIITKDLSSKSTILNQYAIYGNNSPYIKRLSTKEINNLSAKELIETLNQAIKYKVDISYTGQINHKEINTIISHYQKINPNPIIGNSPIIKQIKTPRNNEIYFLEDKKAVQSKISIVIPSKAITIEDRILIEPFNETYGSGLNSIVFKEIREYKALAYTAFAIYKAPYKFSEPGFLYGYLSTQSDKTQEAISLFYKLLDSTNIENSITDLSLIATNSINMNIPSFRNLSSQIALHQLQGYENDPREFQFENYRQLKTENLQYFLNEYIKNRIKIVSIVSNKRWDKTGELTQFGQIKRIKLKSIYTQ